METRKQILHLADKLIREKGYNAFKFQDIASKLGIKNASIHYHFPSKKALGVAVVKYHLENLFDFRKRTAELEPVAQLKAFMEIYAGYVHKDQVCIAGSLATEIYTLDTEIAEILRIFAEETIATVSEIIQKGQNEKIFKAEQEARTEAMVLISAMLASLQLTRLTSKEDFIKIQNTLINNLTA